MSDCIFCNIAERKERGWIVFENNYVVAFFDYNPVSAYHTLVIPKEHYANIFDIPEVSLCEITKAISAISKQYKNKLNIQNLQIISSSGKEAQQDVDHIHFHIVPRQKDDGQDIKWIVHEHIRDSFDELLNNVI